MEWIKVEAGDYWSKDERFHIIKVWDRIYNLHWMLYDNMKKKEHHFDSLKDCKSEAEEIISK